MTTCSNVLLVHFLLQSSGDSLELFGHLIYASVHIPLLSEPHLLPWSSSAPSPLASSCTSAKRDECNLSNPSDPIFCTEPTWWVPLLGPHDMISDICSGKHQSTTSISQQPLIRSNTDPVVSPFPAVGGSGSLDELSSRASASHRDLSHPTSTSTGPRLTEGQADIVQNLYNLNVPASVIAQVVQKMVGGEERRYNSSGPMPSRFPQL